jgi:hypothetical protein
MANRPVEQRVDVEVLAWEPRSNFFRRKGGIEPRLDRIIKDMAIIRLLVLTRDGEPIAHLRNVWLRASQSDYYTPRVQTTIPMPAIQTSDYWYERVGG